MSGSIETKGVRLSGSRSTHGPWVALTSGQSVVEGRFGEATMGEEFELATTLMIASAVFPCVVFIPGASHAKQSVSIAALKRNEDPGLSEVVSRMTEYLWPL